MVWEVLRHELLGLLPEALLLIAALLADRGVWRWRRAPVPAVFLAPATVCLLTAAAALAAGGYPISRQNVLHATNYERFVKADWEALAALLREAGVKDPEAAVFYGDGVAGAIELRPDLRDELEALDAAYQASIKRSGRDANARLLADPLVPVIQRWRTNWWWRDLPTVSYLAGAACALLAAASRGRWGAAGRSAAEPPPAGEAAR